MTRKWGNRRAVCLRLESLESRAVPHGGALGGLVDSDHDDDGDSDQLFSVDAAGHQYCAFLPAAPAAPAEPSGPNQPLFDLSDTFDLHSRLGAAHVIYLDFDGNTTKNTWWNDAGHPTIVTPAFDLDNNPSSFSTTELQRIQQIWQRVAEDYAPFDVDVMTKAPTSPAALDQLKNAGIRVNIGGNGAWAGSPGGVAYVGVFGNGTDIGCFVFPDNLGNGYDKYVADGIAHEVGHTVGLYHDGRELPTTGHEEYYAGQGSGATSWGPIMGAPFNVELTQWSKGEYRYPSNTENDLAIITTNNGFGYRPDDHGNTIPTATAALLTGLTDISGSGIIEKSTDVDYFSFDTGSGQISLDIEPAERGADLDILAQLFDGAHNLIASSNPVDKLSASLTTTVAAGQYFLAIEGVGKGDPLVDGYTDYASLGAYSFTGNIVEPPPTDPIQVRSITGTESRGAIATGFRLTFNVAPDPKTLRTKDIRVTGPTGLPISVTAVRAVPNTVTVFDVLIRPQRFIGTGGVRIYVPPTVAGARGGKPMDQDGNGTPGEATDYFAATMFRFNGSAGVIPDDAAATDFPLTVPSNRTWNIRDLNVRVNLTHTAVGQLQISLVSPSNVVIPLIVNRGGMGNNLNSTLFDDQAIRSVTLGAAPFSSFFQPEGGLLASLNDSDAAGAWNLRITDDTVGETGKLVSWDLALVTDDSRSFPTVTSVTPFNETGSNLAERFTGVVVSFDRGMNPLTVARRDFKVIDPDGHVVAVKSVTSLDAPATQFRVVTAPWTKAGQYTVKVGAILADTYGNDPDPSGNGGFFDPMDVLATTHTVARDAFLSRQTYRKIPSGRPLTSIIAVGESVSISDLAVELNIAHANVGNLKVTLIAPDGTEIILVANEGGNGADFTHTIFSTAASTSIVGASAPFTGDFKAEDESGMAGLVGKVSKGRWKLKIEDAGTSEPGKLLSWGIYLK